jgi:hypothetical protein
MRWKSDCQGDSRCKITSIKVLRFILQSCRFQTIVFSKATILKALPDANPLDERKSYVHVSQIHAANFGIAFVQSTLNGQRSGSKSAAASAQS